MIFPSLPVIPRILSYIYLYTIHIPFASIDVLPKHNHHWTWKSKVLMLVTCKGNWHCGTAQVGVVGGLKHIFLKRPFVSSFLPAALPDWLLLHLFHFKWILKTFPICSDLKYVLWLGRSGHCCCSLPQGQVQCCIWQVWQSMVLEKFATIEGGNWEEEDGWEKERSSPAFLHLLPGTQVLKSSPWDTSLTRW